MSLQIEEVDPFDDDALAAWLHVVNVADEFERGDATTFWTFPEIQVVARNPRKSLKEVRVNGSVDGVVVAAGQVRLPQLDNLSAADVEVSVLPEHRRRGYGSAMLEFCEGIAKEHGRTRLDAMTAWKYDGPADGAGTSGVEFGKVHGYVFGLGDVQREVTLPVDYAVLAELEAEAAERAAGYELRTWTGPFPDDDLLLRYLELSSKLITEAPTGDLDYEDEAVDVEAHRIHEEVFAKQGRTIFTTVALAPDGAVAAYTDLMAPSHDTTHVYQWGTLASREHRGHRLGLAVKVANLRLLQRERPDVTRLTTYNAEVNAHMIGVNEALGFRPVARLGDFQKKLG